VAAFFQYDQRFWDRLSVSAGGRAEYYRPALRKERYGYGGGGRRGRDARI